MGHFGVAHVEYKARPAYRGGLSLRFFGALGVQVVGLGLKVWG